MDVVDRLFQSFKCGVSPPQSAVRERKRNKCKLNQVSSEEFSGYSHTPSSGSRKKRQKHAADVQEVGATTAKAINFSKTKHLSPIVFYGSPRGVPPKRPTSLLRLLREIHIHLDEQKNLREKVWATFPRQDEAIKNAREHGNVHVFSYQDHMNGQRRFLVSTYGQFWQRYKNMNPKFRHHYEVIQEGLPCHLYFDLEFNKGDNIEKNGDEMVDLLISVVFDALFEKYSIEGDYGWIVELDSSTEEKFSRHLIIRIKKTAFKDNTHAGAFVAEICSRIVSGRESDGKLEKLFVLKDSGSTGNPCHLFVDTAVYSRNRCFRLPLSSKAGKTSVLLPTGRFKCKNMSRYEMVSAFPSAYHDILDHYKRDSESEEDVFLASLICNMDVDCEKLLICKMDVDCVKALQFDTEINNGFQRQSGLSQEFTLSSGRGQVSRTYLMGKSPFPALDIFVESVSSIGDVSGKIRSWYWFSEYGLMVYSMSRNRYCERIGRPHKSNHVIYVVDLQRAVYYQKCHDPDCRGYRSPLRPVPKDVLPDASVFFSSLGHNNGSSDRNLECQLVENGQEHITFCGDENMTDSCKKQGWWLEAARVAEKMENMCKTLDLSETRITPDGDEEDWWMAVERTAFQAELTYT